MGEGQGAFATGLRNFSRATHLILPFCRPSEKVADADASGATEDIIEEDQEPEPCAAGKKTRRNRNENGEHQ